MNSATILPPGWRSDVTLQRHIPAPHDYRTFRRLPENPDRYAACIIGGGVFDILAARFLSPDSNGRNGKSCRRRYRLNQGRDTKAIRIFYARIVATLVYGAAPGPDYEAHHVDGVNTRDHWGNIRWQTGPQNRAVEIERQATKRRTGESNGRTQLTYDQLAWFIEACDEDARRYRRPDLEHWSRTFGTASVRQLQRILAGQSRREEVEAIRAGLKEKHRLAVRNRHNRAPYVTSGNPFLDALD